MSTCLVEQRQRAHHAAALIEADPRVEAVSTVGPREDPTDRFVLDVVVDADGVPTDLFDSLAFSLDLRQVAPQGEFWIAHAVL